MHVVTDTIEQQLEQLYDLLKEKGWDVLYEKPTADRPFDAIVVKIYTTINAENKFWQVELSFLPGLEKDIKGFHLAQFFVALVGEVPAGMHQPLAEMITRINTKLPLVGFGLLETLSLLYFKYNILLADKQPMANAAQVNESLSMISYLLANFFGAFTEVTSGKKTVKEAMATMPFSNLYQ